MGEAQPYGTWGLGGTQKSSLLPQRPETTAPSPAAGERLGQILTFCFPASNLLYSSGGGWDLPTHFCLASCSCEALQEEAGARGGRRKGSTLLAICFSSSGSSVQPHGFTLGGSPLLSSMGVPCAVVWMPTEPASQLGLPPQVLRFPSVKSSSKLLHFNNSCFSLLPKP